MSATNSSQHDDRVPPPIVSSSVLSAALATVVALEILAVALYANYRVNKALDPENLADRAEAAIEENYPEFREQLIAQVKHEAPEIAKQVSQELVASAPAARRELEEFTARQIEYGLDQATEFSAEQFRQVLRDNREDVVQVFATIENAPHEARRIVLETEDDIEQSLGVDLQRQARGALTVHRQFNDKLKRLADPAEQLGSKELLERRIVRVLRTIQIRELDREQRLAREAEELRPR